MISSLVAGCALAMISGQGCATAEDSLDPGVGNHTGGTANGGSSGKGGNATGGASGTGGTGNGGSATGGASGKGGSGNGGSATGGSGTGGAGTGGSGKGGSGTGGTGGSGTCTLTTNDATCDDCVQNDCSTVCLACENNTACVDLLDCVANCADTACQADCESQYPGGVDDAMALAGTSGCLGTTCATACGNGGGTIDLGSCWTSGLVECNPVTNAGCTGSGYACDASSTGFTCYGPPNDVAIGDYCDGEYFFCVPGATCAADYTCRKWCCSNTDCGAQETCAAMDSSLGTVGMCEANGGTGGSGGAGGSGGSGTGGSAGADAGMGGAAGADSGTAGGGGSAGADGGGCYPVVNEVQTAGAAASDEFVEIYNPCSQAFDLTGWSIVYRSTGGTTDVVMYKWTSGTLPAGGYLLIGGTEYAGTPLADVTFTNGGLAAAGGGLGLRDSANTVLDSVGWGTATNSLVEVAACVAPAQSQSVARTPNGTDTNNNANDFQSTAAPTPKAANQ